jgi:hypothetical protein
MVAPQPVINGSRDGMTIRRHIPVKARGKSRQTYRNAQEHDNLTAGCFDGQLPPERVGAIDALPASFFQPNISIDSTR